MYPRLPARNRVSVPVGGAPNLVSDAPHRNFWVLNLAHRDGLRRQHKETSKFMDELLITSAIAAFATQLNALHPPSSTCSSSPPVSQVKVSKDSTWCPPPSQDTCAIRTQAYSVHSNIYLIVALRSAMISLCCCSCRSICCRCCSCRSICSRCCSCRWCSISCCCFSCRSICCRCCSTCKSLFTLS